MEKSPDLKGSDSLSQFEFDLENNSPSQSCAKRILNRLREQRDVRADGQKSNSFVGQCEIGLLERCCHAHFDRLSLFTRSGGVGWWFSR